MLRICKACAILGRVDKEYDMIRTMHGKIIIICNKCGSKSNIPFPEYLPIEQAGRYVDTLKRREK